MADRSMDWYRQARRDLDSARAQLADGFYEWTCFISQQAAEKSVKALYQKFSAEAWGHSVSDLLRGLKEKVEVSEEFFKKASRLDRFYIPARYPNGWAAGFPGEYLTEEDAQGAIRDSEEILRFCHSILAG